MSDPLAWLLTIELMGLLGAPLAFFLFRHLPDRGFALSKVLSLLLAAYIFWILGLTGVVPASPLTIVAILLLGTISFGWLYYRRWPELEDFVRTQWRYLLIVEGLFLAVFLVWAFIVSEAPAINHTEKPMDFAFLGSILQSTSFPPEDPWLSGHSISYYYFGHFIMALPMKLAGIASNVGYNLALATIPALVAVGSFSLVYNLVRLSGGSFRSGIWFGLTVPVLLIVVGNLEGALEFAQVRGWGGDGFWQWIAIKGMDGSTGNGLFPDGNWWWWRATRVIDTLDGGASLDYTITEFPFFSFLLGDLHSHVLALPFVLLVLALALNLFRDPDSLGFPWLMRNPWHAAGLALSLGALAFINSWDFPVYAAILGAIILVKAWATEFAHFSGDPEAPIQNGVRALRRASLFGALFLLPLLTVAVFLFSPFYLTLSSQASGILPYFGPGTRPVHFVLVMGLPALLGLIFLWRQFFTLPRPVSAQAPAILMVAVIALAPFFLWFLLAAIWSLLTQDVESLWQTLASRALVAIPILVVAGLAGYAAISRAGRHNNAALTFPLLLLAAASYLLAGAELYHLVDFFGNRMNTVFKVYYQAWLLLSIVGAYGLFSCWSRFRELKVFSKVGQLIWAAAALLFLVAAIYYPVGAILDRTGLFRAGHDFKNNTLDGLDYIRQHGPAEYSAIIWLRDEAEPGRMVEAVGDDYSEYSRVSAATGRPAILGWKGHEHQWRGTTTIFEGREADIARIYQSDDPAVVRRLLAHYDVRYVYLGQRERARYGIGQLASADGLLETVFKRDDVIIYEYNPGAHLNE